MGGFKFDISLGVLNNLGRSLYGSFMPVLGEAISNCWDAEAENVWIEMSSDKNNFTIKDDGCGMDSDDFQKKFWQLVILKEQKE